MNKTEAIKKYERAEKLRFISPLSDWQAVFPDVASLQRFRHDTGNLCWPGSYGQSPWDDPFTVAYQLGEGMSESSVGFYLSKVGECPYVRGHLNILKGYGFTLDPRLEAGLAIPLCGVRQDRKTGQFVGTVNGVDVSPTSFDRERALEIARQSAGLPLLEGGAVA